MSSTATPPREPERRPDLDSLFSVNIDGSHNVIHPADVRGRFTSLRHWLWPVLIGIYIAIPWIKIGGNPAVLLDIPRRHFFLFGHTFTAQDFWLAFFWITGIGFTLFVVSALFGRLWCGYGCPQTVFLEGVFRRIERLIEGRGRKRRALDKAPWNGEKIFKRALKYSIFAAISLVLAHTFLGYFMPVEEVLSAVTHSPSEHWTAFVFVMVLTAIIFVNFASFREQLCIVVCPYGRLQSVLYDDHTINVGYDSGRGEPRGKDARAGDCVDCLRCVAVCPTGIDIRNGTQLECVGCANCIDACDEVMDKIGRPRGLVRYDSLAGFEGRTKRFLRPRVAFYAALFVLGCVVFALATFVRTPYQAEIVRLRGSTFTIEAGAVVNSFSVLLTNKTSDTVRFSVELEGPPDAETVLPTRSGQLEPFEMRRIPLFVRLPRDLHKTGLEVGVVARIGEEVLLSGAKLLGPR